MLDVSAGNLWRAAGGVYELAHTGGICPVPANNTDELLYVMPANGEDRTPGHAVELGRAETVDALGGVVKLVLDQRHELGIATGRAVIGIERDDEVRNESKPFRDLLLDAGLCPLPHRALRCSGLALAYDAPALAGVFDCGPEIPDVSVGKARVKVITDDGDFIVGLHYRTPDSIVSKYSFRLGVRHLVSGVRNVEVFVDAVNGAACKRPPRLTHRPSEYPSA